MLRDRNADRPDWYASYFGRCHWSALVFASIICTILGACSRRATVADEDRGKANPFGDRPPATFIPSRLPGTQGTVAARQKPRRNPSVAAQSERLTQLAGCGQTDDFIRPDLPG